ncbi:MAG: GntR family transcriptional regulator [Sphingobium sp.]
MNAKPRSVDAAAVLHRKPKYGSQTAASRAVERIKEMIYDGNIVPGQRLIEADLAAELDIAPGRIREALRILAGEGVVDLIANRGAVVSRISSAGLIVLVQALAAIMIVGIREFVRTHPSPSPSVQRAINTALNAIIDSKDAPNRIILAKAGEFHALINHLGGNEYVNRFIAKLSIANYEASLGELFSGRARRDTGTIYRRLATALLEGNGARATRIIENAVQRVINELEQDLP